MCSPPDAININDTLIKMSTLVKDLCLRYSNSFNFSEKIRFRVAKAQQIAGLVSRHINSVEEKLELCRMCVRPQIEYCTFLCSILRKFDRISLENTQRHLTKRPLNGTQNMTYKERCIHLKVQTLWLQCMNLMDACIKSL